ncbi:NAD-dependent epimerase/dehydratase family protein [Geodermatophilus sp. CPCC 206100]|uniref:NAD-dependent epimerase/dehydratase family protein n=1 Tax=Geodermatophilus sp. CPCC 206100 TaxID=3020054 RepID=UPI003AFF671B
MTGGAGFIGANLCRVLVGDGVDVVVLDDLSTGLDANLRGVDVDLRIASVLDSAAVADACEGVSAVVHLAAVPSVPRSLHDPRRSHDVNVTGTVAVLDAARGVGAHVVLASSSSVYGNGPELPKSEDLRCSPASPYAVSKLAAESYALAYQRCYGLPCTAFRFFNVFGPLQPPGHAYAAVVPAFVSAALTGAPLVLHGDGDQTRDFTFVDSVSGVLTRSLAGRVSHDAPVNLAFGTRTSLNTLIDVLSGLLGRRLEVDRRPPRPGDVRHSQAAVGVLTSLFPDLTPVPLEEGLRRTIAWMEENVLAATPGGTPA